MRRRQLLAVGAASGLVLAVAGGSAMWWRPARMAGGALAPSAQEVFSAVAVAVLGDLLPPAGMQRQTAMRGHLQRLEKVIAGLPPAMQAELDDLVSLLALPASRLVLTGLRPPWSEASAADVHSALQSLRTSRLALKQQVFHALRDLTNAAHFADPGTWQALGYPGPMTI